jgi:hypothetical protein
VSTNPGPARAAFRHTVKQLREHAGTTFGAAAVMSVPLVLVSVITAMRPGWSGIVVGLVAGGLVGVWVAYSATVATGEYIRREDPGFGGLMRRSLSTGLVRFALTALLVNLITALVAVLTLIPFLLSLGSLDADALLAGRVSEEDAVRMAVGLLVSLPLLLVAMLILYLKLGLSQTASALDGTNPVASLRRSWQVTRGHLGDFFVLTLMSVAVSLVVSLVVSGPAGLVSTDPAPNPDEPISLDMLRELFGPGEPLALPAALVTGISTYLTAVILTPFTAALLANFFILLREPSPAADVLAPQAQVPVPNAAPRDEAVAPNEPTPPEPPG